MIQAEAKLRIGLAAMLLVIAGSVVAGSVVAVAQSPDLPAGKVQNPIIVGDWSDPAFIRDGQDYYTVRSTMGWAPGLAIMHSRDLVNWHTIGNALTDFDRISLGVSNRAGGVWAPDFIFNPNTSEYQIFATLGGVSLFVAKRPEGPYEFIKKLDFGAIDPGVFVDEDGQIYGLAKSGDLLRLSRDGREIEERLGRLRSTDGKGLGGEGPEIYRRGDYYYFVSTHGGTLPYQHQTITSHRSRRITGPWEADPENPLKYSPHTSKAALQGPGHGELIQTQSGQWFITYHVYNLDYPSLARQVALEPIDWTDEGWWRPRHGKIPPLEIDRPDLPASPIRLNQSDEFSDTTLGPQWFFHTRPDATGRSWSLSEKRGWLTLKNRVSSGDWAEKLQRFVVQRMASKSFEVSAKMTFDAADGEMAGLLLYADKENYIQFGVTQIEGQRSIGIRTRVGAFHPLAKPRRLAGIEHVFATAKVAPHEVVYLKIQIIDPETARFSYSLDNENWKRIGREIFFGRSGVPDLGWQTRYWTGATFGLFIDHDEPSQKRPSQKEPSQKEPSEDANSAAFDWIRVK